LNPKWDESYKMGVQNTKSTAVFLVYDYDSIGDDDLIGEAKIEVSDLIKEKDGGWHKLKPKGEIKLKIEYGRHDVLSITKKD